jgi:hypothetical protein
MKAAAQGYSVGNGRVRTYDMKTTVSLMKHQAVTGLLVAFGLASTGALAANSLPAQVNSEGGVQVTVTPLSPASASMGWSFEITLSTHSVELDHDLTQIAVMIDAQGSAHAALAWDGDPPGSHHRKGVLQFQPLAEQPRVLELRIHGVGTAATRIFRWPPAE